MMNAPWNMDLIKHCEDYCNLELVRDSQALINYQTDFGGMVHSQILAIATPHTQQQLIKILEFAHQHRLTLTLRASGLSQSGQSVATENSVVVDITHFNRVSDVNKQSLSISVEGAASWRDILDKTLSQGYIPRVFPANLDLSCGGVISAGGFGSASSRYGVVAGHVNSLQVVIPSGKQYLCGRHHHCDLFDAVRGGVGRFGMIQHAEIAVRAVQPQVRTFYLLYDDYQQWLHDQLRVQREFHFDYLEAFCTPCIQGLRNNKQGRGIFPLWFYVLQLSYEFEGTPPNPSELSTLNFYKCVHTEDNTIAAYVDRNRPRFEMMKNNGSWKQYHPWYECLVPFKVIEQRLPEILDKIPLFLGGIYLLFPIAPEQIPPYFMMPQGENPMAFCILTPGIVSDQVPLAVETFKELDTLFLANGAKRYLSGWLNSDNWTHYWQQHYNAEYETLLRLKETYDPHAVLGSCFTETM